mgnify:CR=1 FL=1
MASELKKETIIYRSGINLSGNEVMTIKKSNFKVIDISVGGDAPKDVVKIYQYNGKMRKAKPKTWPNYIVKIGQMRVSRSNFFLNWARPLEYKWQTLCWLKWKG